jgi:hypothetical protein
VSFVATFVLVFLSIFRPQEIWPVLGVVPLLNVFTGLAAVGVVIDIAMAKRTNLYSPQLPFLLIFVLISYTSTIMALGGEGAKLATQNSLIGAAFMLVVMYGARTKGRLVAIVGLVAVLGVFVSGVAVHMGLTCEPQCIEIAADSDTPDNGIGNPDGRPCEYRGECQKDGRGDVEYVCERVGLFKTMSVERRVRWRGQLGDPNELSVYIGGIIPLLLTLAIAKRRWFIYLLVGGMVALGLWAVILTQSRGGQLVIGTMFAAFFISRYRGKGLIVGILFAIPVLVLGGRSDGDASSEERTEILYSGVDYVIHHPLMGMGIEQFGENRGHTAHNAYLLAAAELGLPGYFAWAMMVYASVKIPISIVRSRAHTFSPLVQNLARALMLSFFGLGVGIFFLSFTFKQLLFVWLGICGALYGVAKDEDPSFEIKLYPADYLAVGTFCIFILAAIFGYTRFKVLSG